MAQFYKKLCGSEPPSIIFRVCVEFVPFEFIVSNDALADSPN